MVVEISLSVDVLETYKYSILLSVQYVSRNENFNAEYMSKIGDGDSIKKIYNNSKYIDLLESVKNIIFDLDSKYEYKTFLSGGCIGFDFIAFEAVNKLNYENYEHIIALLDNYVSLLKHSYPHPDSTTRMICWDLERLIENTKLTDLETFLLRQRVAHRSIALIQKVLIEEGFCLSD